MINRVTKQKPENSRTATRDVRRQQLINATIDSISKYGFSGTTLASVTKGAKMSHGIVNYHFNSKEELYVETLEYLANEHYERWSSSMEKAGADPHKRLAAIIEVDFEASICSRKKISVWFAFWGQAKQRPSYLKMHNNFDRQRAKEIDQLCSQIVEQGSYKHIDAASTARSLIALVDGLWLNHLLYPQTFNRKRARDDCFAFLADAFPDHFPAPK